MSIPTSESTPEEHIAYYAKSPDEIAQLHGMETEELKRLSLVAYLVHDSNRTPAKFNALWSRWSRGKQNMPLCVEVATKNRFNVSLVADTILEMQEA